MQHLPTLKVTRSAVKKKYLEFELKKKIMSKTSKTWQYKIEIEIFLGLLFQNQTTHI